jgi:hypothetical protein
MTDDLTPGPLEHIHPLLRPVVEAVTVAMAGAFDDIWSRPDAAVLADGFLDGTVLFLVARDGVTILRRPGDQAEQVQ